MAAGFGLSTDEGLEQVKWLVECGDVDFVEISGGNAENKSSKLHSKTRGAFVDHRAANRTLCKIHSEQRRSTRPQRSQKALAYERPILRSSRREFKD